jgi:HSP20 family protein
MTLFRHKSNSSETPGPAAVIEPAPAEPSSPAPADPASTDAGSTPTAAAVAPSTPAKSLSTVDAFERFNALFDQWLGWPAETVAPTWLPAGMIPVEETREDGTRVIRAQLPGIDPARDVELFVSDGMLCIDAEHREEHTSDDAGYVRREVSYGAFTRVLPLGEGVTASDVTASYKDGVLEVRVPASEAPQTKAIPITTA